MTSRKRDAVIVLPPRNVLVMARDGGLGIEVRNDSNETRAVLIQPVSRRTLVRWGLVSPAPRRRAKPAPLLIDGEHRERV